MSRGSPLQDAKNSQSSHKDDIISALKTRGAQTTAATKSVLLYKLMAACNSGELEIIKALVERENANINGTD